ncbi:MAG: glutathione S-transferase family protein [Burkholderiales bacterium]|nr:glutathione S-transferase family protein [Burkholderiales bacterium]
MSEPRNTPGPRTASPGADVIELYHSMESICSERVRITLHEKHIAGWISHEIRLFEDEQFNPEYLKLNPKAQVPTLVHNGHVVRESSIICNYLDQVYPDPPLKPATPHGQSRMQEWIKASDEALYQAVSSLSFSSVFRERLMARPEDVREAHFRKQTDMERTHRQRGCVADGLASPYVLRAVVAWEKMAGNIEEQLESGGPWLMGEQFTLAEIALAPFFTRVSDLQYLAIFLEGRPHVTHWWGRMQRRASFLAAEVNCGPENTAAYIEAGKRHGAQIRALRDRYRTDPYACGMAYRALDK